MGLTPLDIHNKEFKRAIRGYSEPEVDEFLDEVVREFESILKDNAALRDQTELMSSRVEQYRQMEDTLHKTLIVAQESADELKASARKEAEAITRQAQMEADRTRQQASDEVRESREHLKRLESEYMKFRASIKGILKAQIELLDEAGLMAPLRGLDQVSAASSGKEQDQPGTSPLGERDDS